MTDSGCRPLTDEKLEFFGVITASLSHELKNVLATINEFSGLLDDLAQAAASGRAMKPERLQSICGKIATQIKRGESLVDGLNRFAHTVDEAAAAVDLKALLLDIMELNRRFANLKQVRLESRFPEVGTAVTIDPFACQHAVYLGIDMALRAATDQRAVVVSLESDAGGPRIIIESADRFERAAAPEDEAQLLDGIMAALGGRVEWIAEPGRDRVALSFAAG